MPKQATATLRDGRVVTMTVRDDATPEQIRASLARRLGGGAPPAPTERPGLVSRLVRSLPSVAGAVRGGTMGAEAGGMAAPFLGPAAPLGPLVGGAVGAAGGAGGAEMLYGLAQRLLGVPEGDAPLATRGKEAAEAAGLSELVGGPVVKGVSRLAGGAARGGTALASRLAKTERFNIPLGAAESAESAAPRSMLSRLQRVPGASGALLKAGQRQSNAVITAGRTILGKLGGPLERTAFAKTARTAMARTRQALVKAGGTKGAGYAAEVKRLFGETLEEAKIAHAVARNPAALAAVVRATGSGGLESLQRSWWTAVLESATGKAGLRKGMIDPGRITAAWDELETAGQRLLFSNKAPGMRAFVDALRQTEIAGTAGKEVARQTGVEALGALTWEALTSGLGAYEGYRHGGRGGALVGGAIGATLPWVAAKALVSPGGAEALASVFGSRLASRAAEATPLVGRTVAQEVGQQVGGPDEAPPP